MPFRRETFSRLTGWRTGTTSSLVVDTFFGSTCFHPRSASLLSLIRDEKSKEGARLFYLQRMDLGFDVAFLPFLGTFLIPPALSVACDFSPVWQTEALTL